MKNGIKFYVITDTHYYAYEELGFSNDKDQKCMNESGAIIDAVFDKLSSQDEIDIILISGDLTNNGERASHEGFIKKLNSLKEKGKKVYVITATHDYGLRDVVEGESTGKDDGKVLRSELRGLYENFGFNDAIAEHESLSYVVKLAPGYRLLALNDDGNGRSFCGYDENQMAWILEQIKEAHDEGDFIFAMTHHPVLPPSPIYPLLSKRDMLGNYEETSRILADAGLQFIFTGHTHIQNIGFIKTEKGKELWDINTGSLVGYPTPIRVVEITESEMRIKTEKIDDFDWDFKGKDPQEYLKEHFDFYLTELFDSMAYDYERFMDLAGSFSLERSKALKLKFLLNNIGKILQKLTFGKVGKLLLISKKIDKSVKGILVKDFIIDIVRNIFSGNEHYSPQTPEYKAVMAVLDRLDPFLKGMKKKGPPFDDLHGFVGDLLYDNTPDNEAIIPIK